MNTESPSGCILQVEDDENDMLLMQYALRNAGVATPLSWVADGQAAIDYLSGVGAYGDRGRYPMPNLVLLDIKLPRRSGMEVLHWIRQRTEYRRIVIVMFTASAYQAEIDEAYAVGANSFVTKPAGADELTALIRLLHTYWFTMNQFPSEPAPDRRRAGIASV